MRRARRAAGFLLPCLIALGAAGGAAAASPTEHEVKAAYLYYLANFIEWPPEALPADSPFVVCVVGDDPFGSVLDETLRGKTVQGKRIVLRRLAGASQAARCHVAFISDSEAPQMGRVLEEIDRVGLLTVGETPRFVERGGHIELRLGEDRRVRFGINLDETRRAGLKVSAQLLKLATPPVLDGGPP